ncbi:MAG: hypothetical protein NT105_18680 [Verrucomicrobia bacterium]|nr:hypothetical protein [Verrucomicrobiota bacterium]
MRLPLEQARPLPAAASLLPWVAQESPPLVLESPTQAQVERRVAAEQLSETASPVARAQPELATVQQLALRAFPASRVQAAQARQQELLVSQSTQVPGPQAARLIVQPVQWKEWVLPTWLASQRPSALWPALLPRQEWVLRAPVFPVRQA